MLYPRRQSAGRGAAEAPDTAEGRQMLKPEVPLKDPCPCGSGRRYKNCCWRRMKRERAAARAAVGLARTEVLDFVLSQEEYREAFDFALDAICSSLYDRLEHEVARAVEDEHAESLNLLAADIALSDCRDEDGRSIIDEYLDGNPSLEPAAREFLEGWRDANLSLYEVTEVVLHSHVVLKDLLSNRLHRLDDKVLSTIARRWDPLVLRLAAAGGDRHVCAALAHVPRIHLDAVMNVLKDHHERYGNRSLSWKRLMKRDWWLLPLLWLSIREKMMMPETLRMVNADGELLESVRVTYHLGGETAMMAAAVLERIPEIQTEKDGSLVWLEEPETGPMDNVLVARITQPDKSTLVVSTNSRSREKRVRLAIEELLDSMIEDVNVDYGEFDPSEMAPSPGVDLDELSPGQMADVERQVLRKLYEKWPDENLPALDGLTPRQAVKSGKGRRKVIELLKTIESGHDAAENDIDLSWLWKELGLRRP